MAVLVCGRGVVHGGGVVAVQCAGGRNGESGGDEHVWWCVEVVKCWVGCGVVVVVSVGFNV